MDLPLLLGLLRQMRARARRDSWSRGEISAHQARVLESLRRHAYAHSPFYQRFHRGFFDRPLHELPVLSKALVMEHFDELVTDRALHLDEIRAWMTRQTAAADARYLGRYWICATSGSTGSPGIFAFDRDEWTTVLASFARGHSWAGFEVSLTHRMKMASVASTSPWHMSVRAGLTLRSWWMPALRLDAGQPLVEIVDRLNGWQPEMLVSYASMAPLLAEEQFVGRLRIHPHLVFTSSEVLTPEARQRAEAAWGPVLFNQYAATETGGMAAECRRHQGMHVFEDLVIVENVDGDNRPVPPGTFGDKLLVTVLWSRSLPLIRYELSDKLRLASELCPCGLPYAVVESVQGRAEDALRLPAADGGEVTVHPVVIAHVLDTVPAAGWQVVQEADSLLVLLAGARSGLDDRSLAAELQQALTRSGAVPPPVEVRHVQAIPRTVAGKAPLVRAESERR